MTEPRKRMPSGEARAEFVRNIDEIKELIIAGYKIQDIYRRLHDAGKITMSYSGFYRIMRSVNNKK